ncbi:velvet factor-domain-containing protein [Diplogelasinospora grovesii]|uniref:Velvet factor-domain-containing protein n=1 Tax=Diplogelasinospora grovesii TaxID=303347 RepID=A0AAN6NHZ4_9PEZI|nr:velvet factor-domain-containing protein [Diplogelasinospora grovesii]
MGATVVAAAAHGIPRQDTPEPEPSLVNRYTKGGRRLWYCLKVIQQPERARACGSGPKSSADRRPVDPPPVVELRIYEGQTWEQARDKDITFLYNANFFLYATLEHARVIAHGRVPTQTANTPPVLTGMPVSGMAYLDRPTEAGYFLFPDLSVRHEGRYRLTFNLYEETKEDKDKDPDVDSKAAVLQAIAMPTGGSFDFRMEAKSKDFIVYSAKKFPGLTESTQLSRVVAEQGCRVRIRRDVRMRRRDGKPGEFENNEDEFARRRRTATPDARPESYRARSLSGSVERTPYSSDSHSQRRPSIADYPPQFPAQNPPPNGHGGHLGFLGGNSNAQYPPVQPQNYPQPPSVPASPGYAPSQNQGPPYNGQPSYNPPPPPPPPQTSSGAERMGERTPSQQSYAPVPSTPISASPRREGPYHHEHRSSTGSVGGITLPPFSHLPSAPSYHPPPPPPQHAPSTPREPRSLPPLQIDALVAAAARLPMPSPTSMNGPRPGGYLNGLGTAGYGRSAPAQYAGTKRAHDQSFRQDYELPRFQDGARDTGASEDLEAPLIYKRADGQQVAFPHPSIY